MQNPCTQSTGDTLRNISPGYSAVSRSAIPPGFRQGLVPLLQDLARELAGGSTGTSTETKCSSKIPNRALRKPEPCTNVETSTSERLARLFLLPRTHPICTYVDGSTGFFVSFFNFYYKVGFFLFFRV